MPNEFVPSLRYQGTCEELMFAKDTQNDVKMTVVKMCDSWGEERRQKQLEGQKCSLTWSVGEPVPAEVIAAITGAMQQVWGSGCLH